MRTAVFLREREGFLLGYTGRLAVSDDPLSEGHRLTQETNDTAALLPIVELVEKQCGERPQRVSADSGFSSTDNLKPWKSETWMRIFPTRIWRGG